MGQLIGVLGALGFLVGVVCLIKPIRKVGIPTRKRALGVLGASFVVSLVGAALDPTPSQQAPSVSPGTPNVARMEPVVAAVLPAPIQVAEISFDEVNAKFGVDSTLTDLQKDHEWNTYDGKCVEWTGELVYLDSGVFGGISIGFKHLSATLTYDVLVSAPGSERDNMLKMQLNKRYTYKATLDRYGGAFLPIFADWGCD